MKEDQKKINGIFLYSKLTTNMAIGNFKKFKNPLETGELVLLIFFLNP
jgi:hypothetical protein